MINDKKNFFDVKDQLNLTKIIKIIFWIRTSFMKNPHIISFF